MGNSATYSDKIRLLFPALKEYEDGRSLKDSIMMLRFEQLFIDKQRKHFSPDAQRLSTFVLVLSSRFPQKEETAFGYLSCYGKGLVIFTPLSKIGPGCAFLVRHPKGGFNFLTDRNMPSYLQSWRIQKNRGKLERWSLVCQQSNGDDIFFGFTGSRWKETREWLDEYLPHRLVYTHRYSGDPVT
jgi:hypothetical protein